MKILQKMVSVLAAVAISFSSIFATQQVDAYASVSGVSKISGLSNDFIRGVDISSLMALEQSGVTYRYKDGNKDDIFKILSDAGVNYVRLRVWNNPYDSSYPYKGYGGGNNDLYKAKVLGKRATDAGMKVYIDFQYSDFWTDPAKQFAPKQWANYSLKYKEDAVYNYTYQSLQDLLDYGVNVQMVQIGNETNGSMCGTGGLFDGVWDLSTGVASLMKEGCYAVDDINKKYNRHILKALHFTALVANGEWYAEQVNKQGVNYDIFAASFYPMWDGTVTDMTKVLTNIAKKYNKKVMVAETAYPFTFNDSDGSANCINNRAAMRYANYSVDLKGQAYALYDVFNGISNVNKTLPGYGLGAFYWEPAWIKADSSTWGTNGSGWISSASGNYERMYTGKVEYFSTVDQGSSWDNMALFDKNGRAMKSLYVFDDIMGWNSKH